MNAKKIICLLLAIAIGIGVLAGCGAAASGSASGSGSSSDAETATFDYSKGLSEDGHFEGVEASDYLTLPAYKGIVIPAEESVAKDEDVQAEIDYIAQNYTTTEEVTDRAVEDGDSLNIDYVGTVDGVEFDGGSTGGTGTNVTIGVTNYIDDFLEQLIGHKPGENFDIEVTFPDDYTNEELAGKDAIFNITINYIAVDVVPTVDDEFVATNFKEKYGFETVQDLRDDITASLVANQEQTYIWTFLDENTEFKELPESVIQFEKDLLLQDYTSSVAQYGLDLETYLSILGYESTDALLEENADYIETMAKQVLIALAVARAESFTTEDKDISAFLGADDFSDFNDYYGRPFVAMNCLQSQVNDFVMENAVRS